MLFSSVHQYLLPSSFSTLPICTMCPLPFSPFSSPLCSLVFYVRPPSLLAFSVPLDDSDPYSSATRSLTDRIKAYVHEDLARSLDYVWRIIRSA